MQYIMVLLSQISPLCGIPGLYIHRILIIHQETDLVGFLHAVAGKVAEFNSVLWTRVDLFSGAKTVYVGFPS